MKINRLLPNKIYSYQLYLFQLEEYDVKRYLIAIRKKGLLPLKSARKKVKWTMKARLVFFIGFLIQLLFAFGISFLLTDYLRINYFLPIIYVFILYGLSLISFLFFIQARDLLAIPEFFKRREIISRASKKIIELKFNKDGKYVFKYKSPIIIGITGSYGKTTMKEVLSKILSVKFKVLSTVENQNTPLGISNLINKRLNEDVEILIVEMGEYVKGDVAEICRLTPPDISIITGINEAHLERYGSMENAIDTKFEIVENTKDGELVLLNSDDVLSVENHSRFTKNKNLKWFSMKNKSLSEYEIIKKELDFEKLGLNFTIRTPFREGVSDGYIEFKTKFLAEYIISYVIASTIIAKELGMRDSEIKVGVNGIKPVEHRLEPVQLSNDILLIDDTYNGNSNGFFEGIELLSRFKNRRKVYITPGLVETGEKDREIHFEIGKKLADVADLVVLIKNRSSTHIYDGLIDSNYPSDKILIYSTPDEAYGSLNKFTTKGDVVMMQNDWSDNY